VRLLAGQVFLDIIWSAASGGPRTVCPRPRLPPPMARPITRISGYLAQNDPICASQPSLIGEVRSTPNGGYPVTVCGKASRWVWMADSFDHPFLAILALRRRFSYAAHHGQCL
jgi:hypothetical protein